ncbi:TetR/AcrR family transcriptional regulator [Pseudomonas palleroniana]|uniref:TetR/AcrR family transcriptional regulator n=1 Tax=Pseudomonas palleroniana TaxID=191390 RepID=UPI001FCAEAF3|nr:TetR/AcrR family transcriptional regulator [Pseudomonas palleroniana]UOK36979.1 TetR/AcrR family transcriptional regulator [Pseudomonas palleroniana]
MAIKEGLRPGGRSARVQESVHSAARELLEAHERSSVTVPMIAARAGVTPSTIYRRWGDLSALLADVALERLRPDGEPANTGSLRGDLRAWGEQYLDEMSSELGRNMMRDVQCSRPRDYCTHILMGQLQIILDRYQDSVGSLPTLDRLLNLIAAPTVYRSLFSSTPLPVEELHELIDLALKA